MIILSFIFAVFIHVRPSSEDVAGDHIGNVSIIDNFLRRMENVDPNNCSLEILGPGIVQKLAMDRFKQQAMTAVTRANLLTYLWKHRPEILSSPATLYMLVTNLVESDALIFGAGNCYDSFQFNNSATFCPYGYRDQATGSIVVKDLAKTHDYGDVNNTEHEWFHAIRRTGVNIVDNAHLREKASLMFLPDEATPRSYQTIRSEYEDGRWSLPYYDCRGGNIWMITYTVPFFGYDEKKTRYVFKGSSGIDIDLRKVDVNQCADSEDNNVFANSHKCKPSTTCVPLAGKGFKRGSYKCVCREGFYFPLELRTSVQENEYYFFNGSEVEKEFDKKDAGEDTRYDTSFECIACAPGCDSCVDDRSSLLAANSLFMATTCGWFVFVYVFRTEKPIMAASPVLLHIILVGALLSYIPMVLHYFQPIVPLCVLQFWFREIGFATMYAAILFKTWRISIVFRPMKYRRVRITDAMLIKRVALVVCGFAALCVLRSFIGLPAVSIYKHSNGMKVISCSFDFWDYSIAACKVVFLSWGIYLTISVRKTPGAFNESRFISWAIYNETIMAIFFNLCMFFLHTISDPDIIYILLFIHIQLTVTGTTAFLFASKVFHVIRAKKQRKDNNRRKQCLQFVRPSIHRISEVNGDIPVEIAAVVQAMSIRPAAVGILPCFARQPLLRSGVTQSQEVIEQPPSIGSSATASSGIASGLTMSGQDCTPVDDDGNNLARAYNDNKAEECVTDGPDHKRKNGSCRSTNEILTVFFRLPESLL